MDITNIDLPDFWGDDIGLLLKSRMGFIGITLSRIRNGNVIN
jgi:hypothetical protein